MVSKFHIERSDGVVYVGEADRISIITMPVVTSDYGKGEQDWEICLEGHKRIGREEGRKINERHSCDGKIGKHLLRAENGWSFKGKPCYSLMSFTGEGSSAIPVYFCPICGEELEKPDA